MSHRRTVPQSAVFQAELSSGVRKFALSAGGTVAGVKRDVDNGAGIEDARSRRGDDGFVAVTVKCGVTPVGRLHLRYARSLRPEDVPSRNRHARYSRQPVTNDRQGSHQG